MVQENSNSVPVGFIGSIEQYRQIISDERFKIFIDYLHENVQSIKALLAAKEARDGIALNNLPPNHYTYYLHKYAAELFDDGILHD
jgi:hypothetical protein